MQCVALSDEQYRESIRLLREGFVLEGKIIKPNPRIATVAVLQASLGLRLGDVLQLNMGSFIKESGRWKLNIKEQKTGKVRDFSVPVEVYSFIQDYAINMGISNTAKLFDISERQVERHLNKVFSKMELPLRSFGSHSYRKYFATRVYLDNEMNIMIVKTLLQHSSVAVTQRYIGLSQKTVEDALAKTVAHLA